MPTPVSLRPPRPSAFSPHQCRTSVSFPGGIYVDFTPCFCFPEPPALHHYCVWCKHIQQGITLESQLEEPMEHFCPHTGTSSKTLLCVCKMLQEHLGTSLPFPKCVKTRTQVHVGEGCKCRGLHLETLRLGASGDSGASFHCAADTRVVATFHRPEVQKI